MIQRREHPRLAIEPGAPLGILGEGPRQDLDRNVAIEPRVACAIDLAHSAFAKLVEDAICTETIAAFHRVLFGLASARPRRRSRVRTISANGGWPQANRPRCRTRSWCRMKV
jgi:hypothetical protein